MQTTATKEIQQLLGGSFYSKLESPSLRLSKYVNLDEKNKRNEISAVCKIAQNNRHTPRQLESDNEFSLCLGSHLMVNMASGILENSGLCLHPFYNYPMIPGSALKGIARHQAWLEWQQAEGESKKTIAYDLARIFGFPTGDKSLDCFLSECAPCAGSIAYLQAIPVDDQWQLVCDVLTPHGRTDYTNPVPSFFIAVEKGAKFSFSLKKTNRTMDADLDLAEKWLKAGLTQQGAGAKTAAGYGWFVANLPANKKSEIIELRLITPGFFGGASHDRKEDTELRVASLRGQLRWWWRTLYREFLPEKEMCELEAFVWGEASNATPQASKLILRVTEKKPTRISLFNFKDRFRVEGFRQAHNLAVPPKGCKPGLFYLSYGMDDGGKQRYFAEPGASWGLDVSVQNSDDSTLKDQALLALSLLCRFGGIGSKSRKGFGSIQWAGAWSLDYCREKAQEFCRVQGKVVREQKTAYSLGTALMKEIKVTWTDPWKVLDQLGLAVQKFAQSYKHQEEKAVLGLPRKIHGPRREPMRHQNRNTHQQPLNLQPNLAEAKNGNKTRFAAPVMYHVEQGVNAGSIIRITAFPSAMIRGENVSRAMFDDLLKVVEAELISQELAPSTVMRQPYSTQPRIVERASLAGKKAGEKVTGVLLEEKTKKGGWKAEVGGKAGPIINSAEMPGDLTMGDKIDLIINSANPNNPSYRWVKQ